MNAKRIIKIRQIMGITQEELSIILGVTKTTVGRYEIGYANPVGRAKVKLIHIDNALSNDKEKRLIMDIVKSDSKMVGAIALGAILDLSASIIPSKYADVTKFDLSSAITSPAGKLLFKTMQNYFK